jgi:hypothetical protein
MTRRLMPLPQAFRQARETVSEEERSSWPHYRDVYSMILDGLIPAHQVRGRWHANPAAIAAKLCNSQED